MGADQQFCLRWNNFHTNITSAFESLRDDEDFVDITLACEGRQVKAHKMVLSACSPYFRSLLKGNPCQHPIVFLKDVTFANLASILDFMYHGEVNVSHNELATFLKTAEALKVRGLAEDDKKKDSDGYIEASSPGPPRDPPDPGSPRPDETSATDTRLSDSPPPAKRQRRRSGTSVQSAEDTNETVLSDVRETSVKNEPQEFNDEDEMLGHSSVDTGDIKTDNTASEEADERNNFGISESVTISRSQAAMQQLQESFGSFLPAMSQSSGFLPHGATDMPRPPFPLEGVQGLPPGISTLPGPSMSQAGASQDTSQGMIDVKIIFQERLSYILQKKAGNVVIHPASHRDQIIGDLLRIHLYGPKSIQDFNLKRRYEVRRVGGVHRLIRRRKGGEYKFIASLEEVFDVISFAHKAVSHGGEKRTFVEARKRWANITQEACQLFMSLCPECYHKKVKRLP